MRECGGMVDATDLKDRALIEKSFKWKLSNSGKPKSRHIDMAILSQAQKIWKLKIGNPKFKFTKIIHREGAETRRELP